MKVLNRIEDLASIPGPTHLAIGVFDGIHLGHQAVIGRAVRNAYRTGGSAIVVTFDPHPARVLRPEKPPRLLMAPLQKRRLVQELGVDAMLTINFTNEFSMELNLLEYLRPKASPGDFSEQIARDALWAKEMNDMESRGEDSVELCPTDS
jgi:FAD synthase